MREKGRFVGSEEKKKRLPTHLQALKFTLNKRKHNCLWSDADKVILVQAGVIGTRM